MDPEGRDLGLTWFLEHVLYARDGSRKVDVLLVVVDLGLEELLELGPEGRGLQDQQVVRSDTDADICMVITVGVVTE